MRIGTRGTILVTPPEAYGPVVFAGVNLASMFENVTCAVPDWNWSTSRFLSRLDEIVRTYAETSVHTTSRPDQSAVFHKPVDHVDEPDDTVENPISTVIVGYDAASRNWTVMLRRR
jgi:hypothetical protein